MKESEIDEANDNGNLINIVILRAYKTLSLPLLIPTDQWIWTKKARSILRYSVEIMMKFTKTNKKIVSLLLKRIMLKSKNPLVTKLVKKAHKNSIQSNNAKLKRRLNDKTTSQEVRKSSLNLLESIQDFKTSKKLKKMASNTNRFQNSFPGNTTSDKEILAMKKLLNKKDLEIKSLRHKNGERNNKLKLRMDKLRSEYEDRIVVMKSNFAVEIKPPKREHAREKESIVEVTNGCSA